MKERIIQFALSKKDKTISLDEIDEKFGGKYYCNSRFHLGNVMSRMIKRGEFERVKKGVYKYVGINPENKKEEFIDPNQLNLFQ